MLRQFQTNLPLSEQGVDADGGLVQDQQLGVMHEGHGEGHSPLLATTAINGKVRPEARPQPFIPECSLQLPVLT